VQACPFTVVEEFASIEFVTPLLAMLIVPLLVIGPPVNPGPVPTLVTVPALPPPLGKVCPLAKVIIPLFAIDKPVSPGVLPFEPNSRFNVADGLDESFWLGSACQRKSWGTAADVLLLYEDA
jgi:hypothetical protein